MEFKKIKNQLVSSGFLVMLTLLTLLMARYGEHMPRPSLLSDASIMVALGMSTSRTS
jgi:hypothetical protein